MESAIPLIRAGASVLLLSAFVWLSFLNWSVFWASFIRKQPVPSWIPLLGGSLGALGFVVAPVSGAAQFWWIPFLIDWGSAPGLLHAGLHAAISRFGKKPVE